MLRPELPEDYRETRALRIWLLAKCISAQKPFAQMLAADAVTLVRLFRGHLRVQGESKPTGNFMCRCFSLAAVYHRAPGTRHHTSSLCSAACSFLLWDMALHLPCRDLRACLSSPHSTQQRHTDDNKQKLSRLLYFREEQAGKLRKSPPSPLIGRTA